MKTAYISGHLKISEDEFFEHYVPKIEEAVANGDSFVVGDARGTDARAQSYLCECLGEKSPRVRVFHMFERPRNLNGGFSTVGGFTSDEDRDAAMTVASDYDIAWVRPGRENSGTANNLKRRKVIQP